jgi:hypothetical protein
MKTFLTVKFALIPFAALWVLLGAHHPLLGVAAAIGLSATGNVWNGLKHRVYILEAGALVLFVLMAVGELLATGWVERQALWASFAGLGLISAISLAVGRPWTAQYSRAAYPDQAETPQFRTINWTLTALWALLFSALAVCKYFRVSEIITTAIVGIGALVSIFGPRVAVRYVLNQMRASQETFRWTLPALTASDKGVCDVAVIGAGIGGLTAAALLADAGLKVEVFEHHFLAGGYCHNYLRKARYKGRPVTYRFDAGPHDFSGVWPGGPISGILERLRVADRIAWRRIDHSYRLPEGTIDVPRDWREYACLVGEKFPGSSDGVGALFSEIHAIFEDMYATGHHRSDVPGMPATNEKLLAFSAEHATAARAAIRRVGCNPCQGRPGRSSAERSFGVSG